MIIWYLSWASVSFSQVFHVEANMFICFRFYIRWGFQYSQSDKSIARTRCCSTFLPVFPGFYAVEANNFKMLFHLWIQWEFQFCFPNGKDHFLNEYSYFHSYIHMFVYVLPDMTLMRMAIVCISAQMRTRICYGICVSMLISL